jgi:DUF1009 family protein
VTSGRLTLFAGSGSLVPPVAGAARRRFDDVQVIDLYGRGDIEGGRVAALGVGDGPKIAEALKSFRTTHVALVGAVRLTDADRESIVSQMGLAGRLARSFGDLGLAGATLLYCRMTGLKLVGAHDVAPDLVAPYGHIAGPPIDPEDQPAIRLALTGARTVGGIDLGQAVVFSGKRAVAAEDAEGTDALLERVAAMRDSGLVGSGKWPLILAKALKPRQPRFVDLPSIGPQTVVNAAAAGISIIALEAGQCLLLDRPQLEAEASARGISVLGLRRG